MFQFGGIRSHAVISIECLADCLREFGVGLCPKIIHEAIYEQAHFNQVQMRWLNQDDLPLLIEVFSRHQVEWVHFDAR